MQNFFYYVSWCGPEYILESPQHPFSHTCGVSFLTVCTERPYSAGVGKNCFAHTGHRKDLLYYYGVTWYIQVNLRVQVGGWRVDSFPAFSLGVGQTMSGLAVLSAMMTRHWQSLWSWRARCCWRSSPHGTGQAFFGVLSRYQLSLHSPKCVQHNFV